MFGVKLILSIIQHFTLHCVGEQSISLSSQHQHQGCATEDGAYGTKLLLLVISFFKESFRKVDMDPLPLTLIS